MHDEDSELAGEHIYAPTTLRSKYSVFKKCLRFSGVEPVRGVDKLIEHSLSDWDKSHSLKQSSFFTKEQIKRFLETAGNDCYWLIRKAIVIVGVAMAARGKELIALQFGDIKKYDNFYKIDVVRCKQSSHKSTRFVITNTHKVIHTINQILLSSYALITGEQEVKIMDMFMLTFKTVECRDPQKRLWRRQLPSNQNGLDPVSGKQVMGKNVVAKICTEVAKFLGLKNWEAFTGNVTLCYICTTFYTFFELIIVTFINFTCILSFNRI